MATDEDDTAIEILRRLGFHGMPGDGPREAVRFTHHDCEVFLRYPQSVHWDVQNVVPSDQGLFQSLRKRLKRLAEWLAEEVAGDDAYPPMKGEPSHYAPSGRSTSHIWSCVYPRSVVNKSYALQVALIISRNGAEVCICLGAARSGLREPVRSEAEDAFRRLQSRLTSIPPHVAQAVEESLPSSAVLRTSWRQPGESEFASVQDWAAYAGSAEGAQASISVFVTVDELEGLGAQIGAVMREMAAAAGPLFRHCYDVPDSRGSASGNPEDAPAAPPAAVFDAKELENLARTKHDLELDPGVYQAVVAAINSGKHVILTGPPGTAKTTLAEVVCELAGKARRCTGYALTTATSDWTTYETIGGLHPAGSGSSLEFKYGILLEALRENQWVVIDELNRSNFDRAFGQLFTVLSGQQVVLPYEDPDYRRRIILCPQEAAGRIHGDRYYRVPIPGDWRIVATMNVFDKSLLFELSFALMRRFAFIEVPSPKPAVFERLWNRKLEGVPDEQADDIKRVLTRLMALRSVKDIGPALFIDMAGFAREYVDTGAELSPGQLAFQLFYSYLLPQYEGITQQQGRDLFKRVLEITGDQHRERLANTLTEVLGITRLVESADGDDANLEISAVQESF